MIPPDDRRAEGPGGLNRAGGEAIPPDDRRAEGPGGLNRAGGEAIPPELSIPVAILAERRPGVTIWQEHVWRAAAVLEEAPPVPDWTKLREENGREIFFAGTAEVMLHRTDTPNYKDNLEAAEPLIWVVLREEASGMRIQGVTVDPGEAEIYTEGPSNLLEALPMPPGLRVLLAAFVAAHHVERSFHKRKRDRQDTESFGRKGQD